MTKKELEKEADEFTDSKKSFWRQGRTCIDSVKQAYITGAEPREKRIAELELKIKHITKHLEPQTMTALFEQVEEEVKQEQRIKELEEENTELKKQQFSLRNERNTFLAQNEQYEKDLIDFNINLTKAKELLEDLIRFQPYIDKETIFLSIGNDWKTAIYKAEQFLKEVSE